MEYSSGSNRASNFKSAERAAQGRFEITSTITPELYDTKSHYQLIVSITKMHETLRCFCQGRSLARCACRVTRIVNFRQCFVFFTLKALEINSAEQTNLLNFFHWC